MTLKKQYLQESTKSWFLRDRVVLHVDYIGFYVMLCDCAQMYIYILIINLIDLLLLLYMVETGHLVGVLSLKAASDRK